ncbi:MAG: MBL fold metallo-hydrolase, partial [Sediminibacterium sp.]
KESGQLKLIDFPAVAKDSEETTVIPYPSGIIPSLSFILANGHTDSMMLPLVEYKGKTIVYAADLLPSVAHIPLPYVMAYDMFPLTTLQEKKIFLNHALQNDWMLFFEHDPLTECCTLKQTEKGIRANDIFRMSDV